MSQLSRRYIQQIGLWRPVALGIAMGGPIVASFSSHGHGLSSLLLDIGLLVSCASAGVVVAVFLILWYFRFFSTRRIKNMPNTPVVILFDVFSSVLIFFVYYLVLANS